MDDESQHKEYTRIIRPYFQIVPPKYRIAVELGAHGKENSNTWNLVHEDEWRAIWVDGSQRAIEQCLKDREGTKISVIKATLVGAGHEGQMIPMYESDTIGYDSTIKAWKGEEKVGVEKTEGIRPATVLEKYNVPLDFDFLSVDLEGMDQEIVLDLILYTEFRPQAILVENQGNLRDLFTHEMIKNEYFHLARNDVNDFWVRETR